MRASNDARGTVGVIGLGNMSSIRARLARRLGARRRRSARLRWIAEVWPAAEELGFSDEETCFGLQFGHGIGVGSYETPMISRVHSLEHPVELEEGMVFALETYCAATDGRSAARIEEEVVVTATGCEVITRFPAEELLVAGRIFVRGADLVESGHDAEPDGEPALAAAVAANAVVHPAGVPG